MPNVPIDTQDKNKNKMWCRAVSVWVRKGGAGETLLRSSADLLLCVLIGTLLPCDLREIG